MIADDAAAPESFTVTNLMNKIFSIPDIITTLQGTVGSQEVAAGPILEAMEASGDFYSFQGSHCSMNDAVWTRLWSIQM